MDNSGEINFYISQLITQQNVLTIMTRYHKHFAYLLIFHSLYQVYIYIFCFVSLQIIRIEIISFNMEMISLFDVSNYCQFANKEKSYSIEMQLKIT